MFDCLPRPDPLTAPGHYRYMHGGQRYFLGQTATGEPPAFDANGVANYREPPPNDVPPNYPCDGCPGR